MWVIQWVWGYTQGAWPPYLLFCTPFFEILSGSSGDAVPQWNFQCFSQLWEWPPVSFVAPPLAFPDPCSSGEFSKNVAHSQFGCYVTCSASDSQPCKLFTGLLLFTLWKRIRLFWMPQSATAHDISCNARYSAFLMSEGCIWLEDSVSIFCSRKEFLSVKAFE